MPEIPRVPGWRGWVLDGEHDAEIQIKEVQFRQRIYYGRSPLADTMREELDRQMEEEELVLHRGVYIPVDEVPKMIRLADEQEVGMFTRKALC